MRGWRSRLRPCAWLALFAVAVQLVLSFGHIHKDDLLAGGYGNGPVALKLARSSPPELPAGPADQEDFCSICLSVALAGALVVPEPPAIIVPSARPETWLPDCIPVIVAHEGRVLFQARAPPA